MKLKARQTILAAFSLMMILHAPLMSKTSLNGYYKFFFTIMNVPAGYLDEAGHSFPPMGMVNNRLRLSLSLDLTDWLTFQGAYDFSPRIQDPVFFDESFLQSGLRNAEYRIVDLSDRLYPESNMAVSSFGLFQNLDRCFVTVKMPWADIMIGRQAIAWGSAKIINPTEVISPFSFSELDTEERRGQDAIRVRIPLGMMNELDLGFIGGQAFRFKKSAFYLRGRFNLFKTDFSLLVMGFQENLLLGIDLARSVGGAGFWLEGAYVRPKFWRSDKAGDSPAEKAYFRTSLGLDTNLTDRLDGFLEYHFNGAGKVHPEDDASSLDTVPYGEGAVYLLGKHYINLGATFQLSPLIPITGLMIWNLTDGSFISAPSLEFNIAENIYLAAGAYIGLGKRNGGPGIAEFSLFPDVIYTSFRFYF